MLRLDISITDITNRIITAIVLIDTIRPDITDIITNPTTGRITTAANVIATIDAMFVIPLTGQITIRTNIDRDTIVQGRTTTIIKTRNTTSTIKIKNTIFIISNGD